MNYLVINVSGKDYDRSFFDEQVITGSVKWEDHHSPTFLLLVELCRMMFQFMQENTNNVCFVHCNAGKGRTGTLICCYLLFCGFCKTADDAIAYYGWKRFRNGRGVTQPSQIRYIFYFEKWLKGKIRKPVKLILDKVYVESLPLIKNNFKIKISIKSARNYEVLTETPS